MSDGRAGSPAAVGVHDSPRPGTGSVLWMKGVPRTQHGPRFFGLGGPRAPAGVGLGSGRRPGGAPAQRARASRPRPACFVRQVTPGPLARVALRVLPGSGLAGSLSFQVRAAGRAFAVATVNASGSVLPTLPPGHLRSGLNPGSRLRALPGIVSCGER